MLNLTQSTAASAQLLIGTTLVYIQAASLSITGAVVPVFPAWFLANRTATVCFEPVQTSTTLALRVVFCNGSDVTLRFIRVSGW